MRARIAARGRSPGTRKLLVMAALVFVIVLGMVFVESAFAATKIYNLYATDGYIAMADGTVVYNYGFVGGEAGKPITFQNSMNVKKPLVPGGLQTIPCPEPTGGAMTAAEAPLFGNAQFPAPIIYCATGDVVEIRLKNLGVANGAAPNDPHTIHLHGLDVNAANDGVPETSIAAVPANSPKGTPGAGNVVVYMFSPDHAGTYMYHCHQEADIHVQMGMYGALVVYNPTDPAAATGPGKGAGGTLHGWTYDKDYVLLESEIDIGQHVAEQFAGTRGAYNPVNYRPQYWFINGLSFPNTIHAGLGFNYANWIAAHPGYDPLYTGSVSKMSADGTPGEKVLLRVINMGFETQPMHMHGYHGKVIGSDQRAWPWANTAGITPWGEGMEKNTLTVGSGETYEWLLNFGLQNLNGKYDYATNGVGPATFLGGNQSRYDPVTLAPASHMVAALPAIPDPFTPPFTYVGGPVIGPVLGQNDNPELQAVQGLIGAEQNLPGGVNTGQFFPFHNHDDYKATNNGVYPGGMFTMLVTTP